MSVFVTWASSSSSVTPIPSLTAASPVTGCRSRAVTRKVGVAVATTATGAGVAREEEEEEAEPTEEGGNNVLDV